MGFSKWQWMLVPVLMIPFGLVHLFSWNIGMFIYIWSYNNFGSGCWLVLIIPRIIEVPYIFPFSRSGVSGDYALLPNAVLWSFVLSIASIYLFNVIRKRVRAKREVVK
jgi:hypothetical protein